MRLNETTSTHTNLHQLSQFSNVVMFVVTVLVTVVSASLAGHTIDERPYQADIEYSFVHDSIG